MASSAQSPQTAHEADGCGEGFILLPHRRKKKTGKNQPCPRLNVAPRLSKNQQRKFKKLEEEKEKKLKSVEVLATLEKYKLAEDAYALLHKSGTRGQRESMREKLRRAMSYARAGLEVPSDIPLLRERREDFENIDNNAAVSYSDVNEVGCGKKNSEMNPSESQNAYHEGKSKTLQLITKSKKRALPESLSGVNFAAGHISGKNIQEKANTDPALSIKRPKRVCVATERCNLDNIEQTEIVDEKKINECRDKINADPNDMDNEKSVSDDSQRLEDMAGLDLSTNEEKNALMDIRKCDSTEHKNIKHTSKKKKERKKARNTADSDDMYNEKSVSDDSQRLEDMARLDFSTNEEKNSRMDIGKYDSTEHKKIKHTSKKKKERKKARNTANSDDMNNEISVSDDQQRLEDMAGLDLSTNEEKNTRMDVGKCNSTKLKKIKHTSKKKKERKKARSTDNSNDMNDAADQSIIPVCNNAQSGKVCETAEPTGCKLNRRPKVVYVTRTEEVERSRQKLPIIMMEQEVMESISENPVTIICGETGCGKTTQVPQFLYEAGFSSSERPGMIGVTQPRRVAVIATAKRLSYEMNLKLGQEVGFQVRHDKQVGPNTRIKFMTDGILLREVQSDFLLRKYSVIILDEAHERSLNTDILIGMLSRVVPLRQSLYEEECKSGKAVVFPLKLVIMSATLRIDEFVVNKGLFPCPPPVVHVPARQFPVTVHFSAKTELVDYVGKAFKKVCAIHKKLPPGGVLVFLTGQAEVHHLCMRLQDAFPNKDGKKKTNEVSEDDHENFIDELADVQHYELDEMERDENWDVAELSNDSDSESDLEFAEEEKIIHEKHDSDWNAKDGLCLAAIKDAFDVLTGTMNISESSTSSTLKKDKTPVGAGPLHVLPLFALLPASAQLKVFGTVPAGSRLVVVATNVAETSITIPGIRYVVDCGRAKEKLYERGSGIAKYEIGWISKASAAQRAGRAGRTSPGHCYRLYSSAIFNDTFPEFTQPEICRAPIEGLILLLKSMGIVKVNNFPFLSQPDKHALIEAEHCLHALSALDPNSGLLTPLGQAIALYPIGPRHSRMLLTVMQIGRPSDVKEASLLLAYAAATVAALSLDSPFVMNRDSEEDSEKQKIEASNVETGSSVRKRLKNSSSYINFRYPLSDALSIVRALHAYEISSDPEEFCTMQHMHARILYEMSKLRKQLVHIYITFSKDADEKVIPTYSEMNLLGVEGEWKAALGDNSISTKHEQVLRQAICAGWPDRLAHKLSLQDLTRNTEEGEHRKPKGTPYQACSTQERVYIHPSSSLRKSAPAFVVYNELVSTSRLYMKMVTAVDDQWPVIHAHALCTFSKPLIDPPPWYDPYSDNIYCWVSPSFGPHLWQLPLHKLPLKSKQHRVSVFACALLQGKVFPALVNLSPNLAADPATLLLPANRAQKRVSELLHCMEAASVDSRSKLKVMWDVQPDFLFEEVLLWVQKKSHLQLKKIWETLQSEAQLRAKELFPKKKRK